MFQKWSLSKCTKTLGSLLLATLTFAAPTYGQPAKPSKPASTHAKKTALPQLLQEVEAKYRKAATLSAEFSQITEDAVLTKKKKSSGKIFIKRPSRVRWETLQPDKNLLVSDGAHFWYYTPPFDEGERGQVIEKKSSDVQSRLANSLLSGSFSMNRDMVIRQKSASQFILIPKGGSAGTVVQAQVDIDPKEHLIQKVTLNHRGGNRAEITLSQIELGKELGDGLFVFQMPPNTDKLDDFSGK